MDGTYDFVVTIDVTHGCRHLGLFPVDNLHVSLKIGPSREPDDSTVAGDYRAKVQADGGARGGAGAVGAARGRDTPPSTPSGG